MSSNDLSFISTILKILDKYCKYLSFYVHKIKTFRTYTFLNGDEWMLIECVRKTIDLDLERFCIDNEFRVKVKKLIISFAKEIEKCVEK